MPTDPELEAIAKGLTKAQRREVEYAEYHEANGAWHPAGWYVAGDKRVRIKLCRLKLTVDYLRHANRLTPLGLRLRAHLATHPDKSEGEG